MKCRSAVLITASCGTFAVLASVALPALAGGAHMFDKNMQPVLANYLKIQEALAQDSTDGVQRAARSIAEDAAMLDAESVTGETPAHYRDVPAALRNRAKLLSKTSSLEEAREVFKRLSKPMAMWGIMSKPTGIDVLFCSMAKSSWLQKHGEVRNPYYGKSRLTCGEIVGRAGHSTDSIENEDHGSGHSMESMKHEHHGGN